MRSLQFFPGTSDSEPVYDPCVEQAPKIKNLATVMTLYSQRSFSKESLQWCKCIVKYLYDAYHDVFLHLLGFLVEMLEKGPNYLVPHVLTVLYCILLYLDISGPTTDDDRCCINSDLLKTMSRYVEGNNWKDALCVIKHVVTGCSVLPPNTRPVCLRLRILHLMLPTRYRSRRAPPRWPIASTVVNESCPEGRWISVST